jgi:hypothetical protein
MKSLSVLVLLLSLLGGMTACANKTMTDQHSQAQDNSAGMGAGTGGGMGGGASGGAGGGGRY